ncbi:MAG: nucleoside hydrolase [Phycisphaerales bacterium]|nr:MAG: nucleoside hydrolase [Phycisphaerales bacterium]
MAVPVLIDTDMGVDDALAICLALASERLDVRAIVSVGGNVDAEQATANIGRLLAAVQPDARPAVGRGLDQEGDDLLNARWLFGQDGLGGANLPKPGDQFQPRNFRDVYADAIDTHGEDLVVVAIGPLSNVAALQREDPERYGRIGRIIMMGGAVFVPGNVQRTAEFNFYRDAAAAAEVLGSGQKITLVPLDVTEKVALDDSHVGHFGAANTALGPLLAEMMSFPMAHARPEEHGRFIVHDAVAVGALLWPELFMHTRVCLVVDTVGRPAGKTTPAKTQNKSRLISMILSVNASTYLERLMDVLCHERFHV